MMDADEPDNGTDDIGACHDLDAVAVERVAAFMTEAVRAFALRDPDILEALSHEGGDARGRKNTREFRQLLMDGGDKIRKWSARPYPGPTGVPRMFQHHPPPTISIDVILNNGERDYPISFSLAPDKAGILRSCYYIDREKPRKSKKESRTDVDVLNDWLSRDRSSLATAITTSIRSHVAKLKSDGIDFYGYALMPGDPADINSITVATNCTSDIEVPPVDRMYRYYKYSVDEWKHWEYDRFEETEALLAKLNAEFASLHQDDPNVYVMDEHEIRHSDNVLRAILTGMEAAKASGVFPCGTFLAIWISDSDHPIAAQSVRALNPKSVANDFLIEFG